MPFKNVNKRLPICVPQCTRRTLTICAPNFHHFQFPCGKLDDKKARESVCTLNLPDQPWNCVSLSMLLIWTGFAGQFQPPIKASFSHSLAIVANIRNLQSGSNIMSNKTHLSCAAQHFQRPLHFTSTSDPTGRHRRWCLSPARWGSWFLCCDTVHQPIARPCLSSWSNWNSARRPASLQ